MKYKSRAHALDVLRTWTPKGLRTYRVQGEVLSPAEMNLIEMLWNLEKFGVSSLHKRDMEKLAEYLDLLPYPKWFVVTKRIQGDSLAARALVTAANELIDDAESMAGYIRDAHSKL